MITIKYAKRYPLSMVSHIDMLRVMNRILRRADIEVDYSIGFNPHMLVFFSPALSLGVESVCEYVTAAAHDTPDLKDRLNRAAPEGFTCLDVKEVDKNPNYAGTVFWARYDFCGEGIGKFDFSDIHKGYEIEYKEKGVPTTKDISELVGEVNVLDDNRLSVVLACGNKNLKANRFIYGVAARNGYGGDIAILKTHMYNAAMEAID